MAGASINGYTEILRASYPQVPESADFVMYWWHKAAMLVGNSTARRFGFITTNSLRQSFNRRVVQKHLQKLSLAFVIPDHPWVDTGEGAAVRIAMTVAVPHGISGELRTVIAEEPHSDGSSLVSFTARTGHIAADLTTGANVADAVSLKANQSLSSRGVIPHGEGFVVTAEEAKSMGYGTDCSVNRVIKPYRNGKDLTNVPRDVLVIDLAGQTEIEVRQKFPAIYQHLLITVKPERDLNRDPVRRAKWWLFARSNEQLRNSLAGLVRYIATVQTAKHRFFTFLDASILPDDKLIAVGLEDAFFLGVLSSRIHVVFALAAGSRLGFGNDPVYDKTRCFDTFPFPACNEAARVLIRALGDEIDAHRKRAQVKHPGLSLTAVYNVLAALQAGRALTVKEQSIHDDGFVSILRQLHDELDAAVASAYGWPAALSDSEILTRLVALNADRAAEEAAGNIRWLRPDYQASASGGTQTGFGLAATDAPIAKTKVSKTKTPWPKTLAERVQIVEHALQAAAVPITAASLAKRFSRAKPSEIVEILDTLAILGRAHRNEEMFSA